MNIRYLSFSFLALLLSSIMKAEIGETIVAASLFPVSIDDSANSINVISAEDIENTPHLNLADLLRDLPGISVSQSGVLGSQIQIRVRLISEKSKLFADHNVQCSEAMPWLELLISSQSVQ